MNYTSLCRIVLGCSLLSVLTASSLMAQTNQPEAGRWLAGAQIAPAFQVPKSLEAWQVRRASVRSQLWQLLGRLPARDTASPFKVISHTDQGDFIQEKIEFDNGAGATVPGHLLLPKNPTGKSPAILFCHWHGGEFQIGKDEIFQNKHYPEAPGPALAKKGFVVLAIDAYCFGERQGKGPGGPEEMGVEGEISAAKFNLWTGRTLWGMMLRDELIGIDQLSKRPEVDANRIGVMGMSMGATRAWWLMALDERFKAGAAIACLTRYENLIRNGQLKAHGLYYFVPNIMNYFDSEAVVSLIAPRPALYLNGGKDAGSPTDGIRIIENTAKQAYKLYGAEKDFQSVIYPDQGHTCTVEMWEKSVAWMETNLAKGK